MREQPVSKQALVGREDLLVVVFGLQGENFAAPVFQVREVIKSPTIVKIPQSEDFVEGMINIRGSVIPVINLNKRLFLAGEGVSSTARVIIVELGKQLFGIVVDSVTEVIRISKSAIQPAPAVNTAENKYIEGVVWHGEKMVILLDLGKLLSADEHSKELLLQEECLKLENDGGRANEMV